MTRYARLTMLLLSALVLGLPACGGDDDEGATGTATTAGGATTAAGGGGGATIQLAAEAAALEYDKTSLEAPAGSITIEFENPSGLPHNVKLEGSGVDGEGTDTINSGSTSVTLELEAGEYTFYCSVDGHRDAGMEGKLVVN
jgi:plastocyanin